MSGKKVLFLCVNNACRSQMAEGFLRSLAPESFEAYSAGSEPTGLNPVAVKVMREVGIDISSQLSRSVSEFEGCSFDFVITVCGGESCPFFSGEVGEMLEWGFEDPAAASGTEEEVLEAFRRVRDGIGKAVRRFISEHH